MNPWLMLAVAIVAEVVATSSLKLSAGFTRLLPSLLVIGGYSLAFWLLAQVVTRLELGIVYAIWCGAGIALVAAIGIFAYGESVSWQKLLGLLLVAAGAVLLSLSSKGH